MVRIFGLKDLDDRKRVLLAQGDLHRQTLKLEVANIKLSAALLRRKFNLFRAATFGVGAAASVAGFLFARRRSAGSGESAGLLSKLRSGLKLWGMVGPLFKHFQSAMRPSGKGESPVPQGDE